MIKRWDGKATKVPRVALCFSDVDDSGIHKEENGFTMRLYSGAKMPHWYFGQVIVDLAGMKMPPNGKEVTALRDHDRSKIVGAFMPKNDGKTLTAEAGRFTDATPDGREIKALLDDKIPMQCSMYAGKQTRLETLFRGKKATVNGREIEGPTVIIRESELGEGSFCVIGIDTDTEALAASADDSAVDIEIINNFSKENAMTEQEMQAAINAEKAKTAKAMEDLLESKTAFGEKDKEFAALSDIAKKQKADLSAMQAASRTSEINAWAQGLNKDKGNMFSEDALKDIVERVAKLETNSFADGETAASVFMEAFSLHVRKSGSTGADFGSPSGKPQEVDMKKAYESWAAEFSEMQSDGELPKGCTIEWFKTNVWDDEN